MKPPSVLNGIFAGEFDQVNGVGHLFHDVVADICTSAAADAFVLKSITNVDACGADLNTKLAVDAVAQAQLLFDRLLAQVLRSVPPGFSSLCIVTHDQGVGIEHGALKPCIGTHVFANLLPHETRVAIGGQGIKQNPKQGPTHQVERPDLVKEISDRHKVTHKGQSRPKRDQAPNQVLAHLFYQDL